MVWAALGAGPILLIMSGMVEIQSIAADPEAAAWYRGVALLVISTGSFAMLQYETMHSYHHGALPKPMLNLFDALPPVVSCRRRHRLHHTKGGVNYCITWPLSDFVFGTLDEAAPP